MSSKKFFNTSGQLYREMELSKKHSCGGGKKIPVSDPPKGSMVATRVSFMRSERSKNGMIYMEIGSVGG